MQSFSITEALNFGFRMFLRNFWLLLGLSLAGAAVQIGAGVVSKMIIERSGLLMCQSESATSTVLVEKTEGVGYVVTIVTNKLSDLYKDVMSCLTKEKLGISLLLLIHVLAAIFGFVLLMGWNRIALDLYDHGASEFSRAFTTLPLFFSYLIAWFLYSFIVGIGMILLIIPGLIWLIKYSFFDLIIVDTNCGPTEALSRSGFLTYGHKWQLLLFALVSIGFIVISIPTIVGPFILAYVLFLSRAYIYRTLQLIHQKQTPVTR